MPSQNASFTARICRNDIVVCNKVTSEWTANSAHSAYRTSRDTQIPNRPVSPTIPVSGLGGTARRTTRTMRQGADKDDERGGYGRLRYSERPQGHCVAVGRRIRP